MNKRTSRMIEELPWLLEKTAAWGKLHSLLRDTDNFHRLWTHNPSEVKIYWKKIETQTKKNRVTAYAQTETQLRRTSLQIRLELATFFFETGYPAEAEHRLLSLCNMRPARKNRDIRQQAFGLMGNLCFASGRYGDAGAYYRRKMAICRKDGNRLELSRVLGNLGVMAETTGNYNEALACYEQAGQECRKLGFVHGIQAELGNRGNVYMKIKKFDEATALFDAQEQVCRESGHIPGLVAALGNRGFLMLERGDCAEALCLFDEQETLCQKINDLNQLQIIYGNRAVALYRQNRKPEALQWLEKQLTVSCRTGNFDGQQKALERLAILRFDGGEKVEALELCGRRVELCRRHKARIPCAESLRQYAVALKACGRDGEAQSAFREAEMLK